MGNKSKDAYAFNNLKKLGFAFSSIDGEFTSQPDSSGTVGGLIGMQEYGIIAGVSIEELVRSSETAVDDVAIDEAVELDIEEQLFIDPEGDFGVTSEWTTQHALEEQDIVEKQERFADRKVKSKKTR